MQRLIVTTTRRYTPYTEPSGYIYLVDAGKRMVLERSIMNEPAFREVDPNPRGGMRGSRGMSVRDDQIAISNHSVIFRYDPHWNLLGIISHPSMASIHDIYFDRDDTLWVTAARNDLLFRFDLFGTLLEHYYLRLPSPATVALKWRPPILMSSDQIIKGALEFRDPRTHEEERYDHAHVNSVCRAPDGSLLVSMGLVLDAKFSTLLYIKSRLVKAGIWPAVLAVNRGIRSLLGIRKNMHSDLLIQPARARSAVVRISSDGDHRLLFSLDGVTVPSHSLLILHDQSGVYLNTNDGAIIHFDPKDGYIYSSTKVTDGFLRGAVQISDNTLLLGSKREILVFDLSQRKVKTTFEITQDPNESIYDIKVLPDHFEDPPKSFADHFRRFVGFSSEELPIYDYRIPVILEKNGA